MTDKNDISDDEMNESSENEFKTSFIDNLDDDCLLHIFTYLSLNDIISTQKVCERWEQLCQQRWKEVKSFGCDHDHWCLQTKPSNRIMFEGKNMEFLKELLQHCGQFIKHYHLSNYENSDEINSFLFITVAELCQNIVNADIKWCGIRLPFIEIRSMAINWKNLEKLSIPIDHEELEDDLCKLLENNQKIKSISVVFYERNDFTPGKFLEYLSENIIESISVEIHSSTAMLMAPTKFSFKTSKKFTNLKSFGYRIPPFAPIDEATLYDIADFVTLNYLHLERGCLESPNSMIYMGLQHLKEIRIHKVLLLLDYAVMNLCSNCLQLEVFDISFCELTDKGIDSIAKLKKLSYLNMNDMGWMTFDDVRTLSNSFGSSIYDTFEGPEFGDSSMIRLMRKATNLRYLGLCYGSRVTPQIIEAAVDITNKRQDGVLMIDMSESDMPVAQLPCAPFLSYNYRKTAEWNSF